MKINLITFIFLFLLVSVSSEKACSQSLTGLNINSEQFQKFVKDLGTEPKIVEFDNDDGVYYVFKSKGIEFYVNEYDIINTVWVYSEGADGYRQYQGIIPHNLKFTDNRKTVEQKLGQPDENLGGVVIDCESYWFEKGISITYKTKDSENMMSPIKKITIGLKK